MFPNWWLQSSLWGIRPIRNNPSEEFIHSYNRTRPVASSRLCARPVAVAWLLLGLARETLYLPTWLKMTADMDTQNEYDDSGLPGPGAPTPLSALEVRNLYCPHNTILQAWFSSKSPFQWLVLTIDSIGCCGINGKRYQIVCRCRLSHCRINCVYVRLSSWMFKRTCCSTKLGELKEMLTLALVVHHRPKRLLEQIKGISEQKATKVLVEG